MIDFTRYKLKSQKFFHELKASLFLRFQSIEMKIKENWASLKQKVKNFSTNVKKRFSIIFAYCNYYFSRSLFIVKKLPKLLLILIIKSKLHWAFFVIALFASSWWLPDWSGYNRLIENQVTIYTSIGAMLGGVIALVFSLSTFLIQNAASNFSAGFYKVIAKDRVTDWIYFFVSLTSILFFYFAFLSTTFFGETDNYLLWTSRSAILILGLALMGLYILFVRVKQQTDPFYGLRKIRSGTFKKLDYIQKNVKSVVGLMLKKPSAADQGKEKILTREQELTIQAFAGFRFLLSEVNLHLEYLYDLHDKFLSRNEQKLAFSVLDVVAQILYRYLDIRSGSSVILPSEIMILASTSDSQWFLTPNLERLRVLGESYIRTHNEGGAVKIVDVFGTISQKSITMTYLPSIRSNDNPIYSLTIGYFGFYLDFAIQNHMREVIFQTTKWYASLAVREITNDGGSQVQTVLSKLNTIGLFGVVKNESVLYKESLKSMAAILNALALSKKADFEVMLGFVLDPLFDLLAFSYKPASRASYSEIDAISEVCIDLRQILNNLLNQIYSDNTSDDDKKLFKNNYFTLLEELASSIRSLAEKIKSADHTLVGFFADLIKEICEVLGRLYNENGWEEDKEELLKLMLNYLYRPASFVHNAEKIEDTQIGFQSLLDAVTHIGLIAIELDQPDLAIKAVEQIAYMAKEMLKKESGDRYGFTEPRIMEKACFIGIYAQKKGFTQVVTRLKILIAEFESEYKKIWVDPFKVRFPDQKSELEDRLLYEVVEIKKELRRYRPLGIDRAISKLSEKIDSEDIDKFTAEIWGVEIEVRESTFNF